MRRTNRPITASHWQGERTGVEAQTKWPKSDWDCPVPPCLSMSILPISPLSLPPAATTATCLMSTPSPARFTPLATKTPSPSGQSPTPRRRPNASPTSDPDTNHGLQRWVFCPCCLAMASSHQTPHLVTHNRAQVCCVQIKMFIYENYPQLFEKSDSPWDIVFQRRLHSCSTCLLWVCNALYFLCCMFEMACSSKCRIGMFW